MNSRTAAPLFIMAILAMITLPARAQGGLARKAAVELIEFFSKSVTKEASKDLVEIGGEKAVREVVEKAFEQGGEKLVGRMVSIAKAAGPRTLKAVEPDPALMTKALQALPEGKVADAVIEAARQPALMCRLVGTHGDEVLMASVKHPGVGIRVVDEFGGAGLKAARELGSDEIIILAKTKGFRELPEAAQRKFVGLLDRDPKAMCNLLLLAGGGTAIVLTADFVNKAEDKLLGKTGVTGPLVGPMVTLVTIVGGILAAALVTYASIKLWGVWRCVKGSAGPGHQNLPPC